MTDKEKRQIRSAVRKMKMALDSMQYGTRLPKNEKPDESLKECIDFLTALSE